MVEIFHVCHPVEMSSLRNHHILDLIAVKPGQGALDLLFLGVLRQNFDWGIREFEVLFKS